MRSWMLVPVVVLVGLSIVACGLPNLGGLGAYRGSGDLVEQELDVDSV